MSLPISREFSNAIRFLAIDATLKAKSGHPGMPMGMADIATVLWTKFLKHNPKNPHWINRDRFVLSNGHGSMLLYALLHLSGYSVSIEDIKNFRQLHSKTPGHPEYGYTPGVETTTGPLGQGLANAVGIALGEKLLSERYNTPDCELIDHHTYVFLGDGCLMEGISHEACSLAGTLGLNKLIAFWDDNGISIDGDTKGWFTDNTVERFRSYGWHVIENVDGHDTKAIEQAIIHAQSEQKRPTLVCCKTVIGFGSPEKAGTASIHGSPLSVEERNSAAKELGWQYGSFEIPNEVYRFWDTTKRGQILETNWQKRWEDYKINPKHNELKRILAKDIPTELEQEIQNYIKSQIEKPAKVATRKASQMSLEVLCKHMPEMFGGSADLTGSNNTNWSGSVWLNHTDKGANYLSYGVREFGMAAIMNGLSLYGGLKPYGGTFLVFSDYSRNAIRMSALMKQPVVHVMSHDSIGLGEDGPTHQPIEHIPSLRLIPNLHLWRPADTIETMVAWYEAIKSKETPSVMVLTRQGLQPIVDSIEKANNISKGGYLVKRYADAKATIVATGSEVELAVKVANEYYKKGTNINVVSIPCVEIFDKQDDSYKTSVIRQDIPAVFVELAQPGTWYKYMPKAGGEVKGITTFGESAPAEELFEYFGFTVENISNIVAKYV
ncbi:transketolase [Allofrancisella guangzhouensis]|uniref:Transketolase n=1 Tax=Allofrancisella guangzhouensis TaxID=594679 RepID=A0A0A8E5E9_9GAMM|nr:transketolase [Allofrancisella guangzhouensis]AJC49228.1 transketolase [Allofrancisella guangzhouensis]MBK2027573.1 transketolase [Allofrancisella guangzhouensis]MBK2043882.1 transketolase [Allofrancisella guangzhouensis]MBK2045008.1 transketolase [Allofrancisella guangzhouensis]